MPRKKSQNKNSGYKDKLFRIDAELAADLESIAEEQGTSQTTNVFPLHRVLPCKWCDDIALGGNG